MTVKNSCKNNRSQIVKQQYAKEFLFISNLLTKVDLPCQESDSSGTLLKRSCTLQIFLFCDKFTLCNAVSYCRFGG